MQAAGGVGEAIRKNLGANGRDVVGSNSEVVGIGVCENDEAKLTGVEIASVGDGMAADWRELARGTKTALAGCVAGGDRLDPAGEGGKTPGEK